VEEDMAIFCQQLRVEWVVQMDHGEGTRGGMYS